MPELTRNPRRKGAGRVAFLARLDLIQSLLDAGHSCRAIHDDHLDGLGISYSQFSRYLRRYTRPPAYALREQNRLEQALSQGPVPAASSARQSTEPGRDDAGPAPQNQAPPSVAGTARSKPAFTYDPEAGNNRDDLI